MSFLVEDTPYLAEQAEGILKALGGKQNIAHITACITRLRVTLNDKTVVNDAELIKLGSKSNLFVSDNELHIVLGKQSDDIAEIIKKSA